MQKGIVILIWMCAIVSLGQEYAHRDLLRYVDPIIGTGTNSTQSECSFGKGSEERGQTLPAVLVPHGMNFWTPQTQNTEKKCVAPYYYEDSLFLGFRNSHWIVGGCTQDYGSFTITPQFKTLRTANDHKGTPFRHIDEISQPNYYSVLLQEEHLKAEMTGKSRSAIFKFTFTETGKAYIVITTNNDYGEGEVLIHNDKNIIYGINPVHRIYQSKGEWAGFNGYFIAKFQKKPIEQGTFTNGAWFGFDVKAGETLMVKAASSFCDHAGAERNLSSEIPTWDFDAVLNDNTNNWERLLNKIVVDCKDEDNLVKFYTSLYHTSFLPRNISDVDGRRPKFDNSDSPTPTIVVNSPNYYTDFSLWDTYRAVHPLFNIIDREKNGQMMQSLVDMYKEGGWLPIFPCWNSYTCAMIGDHAISALTDAYVKGVHNFDMATAYEAMRKNAFEQPSKEEYSKGKGRRSLKSYLKYGYIPLEDSVKEAYHQGEQMSRTLEYSYDDYCLSVMAKALGKEKDNKEFIKRSQYYKNVFDPKTGYVQGRHKNGKFITEHNKTDRVKFLTEGSPCHYSWYVPHDIDGLITIMGGKKAFVDNLDSLFTNKQYWHGNEPCHQIAYMYNFADNPNKTQETVREILQTEYGTGAGGLSGNDDAGQMSSWYVFSALGFYPVCPGSVRYEIGSPIFPYVCINLDNGKQLKISAHGVTDENRYIKSIRYNGQPYHEHYITHDMIMNGGVLEFEMTGNK